MNECTQAGHDGGGATEGEARGPCDGGAGDGGDGQRADSQGRHKDAGDGGAGVMCAGGIRRSGCGSAGDR